VKKSARAPRKGTAARRDRGDTRRRGLNLDEAKKIKDEGDLIFKDLHEHLSGLLATRHPLAVYYGLRIAAASYRRLLERVFPDNQAVILELDVFLDQQSIRVADLSIEEAEGKNES